MKQKNSVEKKWRNIGLFMIFVMPALFIWLSVVIIPFIYGIGITFTDWNGLSMNINFVGLDNYKQVFSG